MGWLGTESDLKPGHGHTTTLLRGGEEISSQRPGLQTVHLVVHVLWKGKRLKITWRLLSSAEVFVGRNGKDDKIKGKEALGRSTR